MCHWLCHWLYHWHWGILYGVIAPDNRARSALAMTMSFWGHGGWHGLCAHGLYCMGHREGMMIRWSDDSMTRWTDLTLSREGLGVQLFSAKAKAKVAAYVPRMIGFHWCIQCFLCFFRFSSFWHILSANRSYGRRFSSLSTNKAWSTGLNQWVPHWMPVQLLGELSLLSTQTVFNR